LPDWITHLGIAYGGTRLIDVDDFRPVLLGAILPDVTRFAVILIDFFHLPAIATFTYLIPFHSLLITAIMAMAIALLFNKPLSYWRWLMLGALIHFALDEMEGPIGCGSTTFYPFYYGRPISLWWDNGFIDTAIICVALVILILGLFRGRRHSAYRFSLNKAGYSASLLLLAAVIPLFTRQALITQNAYGLAFIQHPESFNGNTVELCVSEVVKDSPLTIEEFDRPFILHSTESVPKGAWLSVRGVYRDGLIQPSLIFPIERSYDPILSIGGFLFLVIYWMGSWSNFGSLFRKISLALESLWR
jgi:hypothetical protein